MLAADPSLATPWVLLHGFLGQPTSFAEIAPKLDAAPTLARLPGHGPRPWFPEGSGFDAACDAIAATLPERFRLAGYSMGGRVALGLAARLGARVQRLVLVGAHPGLDDAEQRTERLAWEVEAASRLRRDGLAAFVDAWEHLPIFASQQALAATQRKRRREERLGHTVDGLAWALEHLGLGAMPSLWPALVRLSCPVTLVSGAGDAKQRALNAEAVRRAPRIRGVVVPNAGHDVPLEAPDAFVRVLEESPTR